MLDEDLLSSSCSSLHSINDDRIGASLDCQLHVVANTCGAELDVDRNAPVGDLAKLGDLNRKVIGAHPVGMAASRSLVNPLRKCPHSSNPLANLQPEEHTSSTRFSALTDHHLDGIGFPQVIRVEAIPRGKTLID